MNGSTLAKLLSDADVSASWLARRLEVSRMTTSRWVRGIEPIPARRVDQIEALFAARLGDLTK